MVTNRRHAKKTTGKRRKARAPVKDRQNYWFGQPGYSDTSAMHLWATSLFLHVQQGGKRNGALLGSLREMREPRLPLYEKIPARYDLQVVKTCIKTKGACENTDFLRDGWATG